MQGGSDVSLCVTLANTLPVNRLPFLPALPGTRLIARLNSVMAVSLSLPAHQSTLRTRCLPTFASCSTIQGLHNPRGCLPFHYATMSRWPCAAGLQPASLSYMLHCAATAVNLCFYCCLAGYPASLGATLQAFMLNLPCLLLMLHLLVLLVKARLSGGE